MEMSIRASAGQRMRPFQPRNALHSWLPIALLSSVSISCFECINLYGLLVSSSEADKGHGGARAANNMVANDPHDVSPA